VVRIVTSALEQLKERLEKIEKARYVSKLFLKDSLWGAVKLAEIYRSMAILKDRRPLTVEDLSEKIDQEATEKFKEGKL